jgi:hypothetical protein
MMPAQAGVFIIVKNSVTERFDIQDVYSSSTEHGQGRVVSFKLTPKPFYRDSLSATRETCFYLQSGSGKLNSKSRKAQIAEMSSLSQDTPVEFWGGDTNMHDNSLLESFLAGRKLEEVLQPQNTFFRMNKSLVTGTRIDKWYCNVSPAQWAVAQPSCRVLSSTPQTIGSYFGGNLKKITYFPSIRSDKATHITDHIPVALYVLPPGTKGNASDAPSIPNWVLCHPIFLEKLSENWSPLDGGSDPFEKLQELSTLIQTTAVGISKSLGPTRTAEKSDLWKTALNTYRVLVKPESTFLQVVKAAKGDKKILLLLNDYLYNENKVQGSLALRNF